MADDDADALPPPPAELAAEAPVGSADDAVDSGSAGGPEPEDASFAALPPPPTELVLLGASDGGSNAADSGDAADVFAGVADPGDAVPLPPSPTRPRPPQARRVPSREHLVKRASDKDLFVAPALRPRSELTEAYIRDTMESTDVPDEPDEPDDNATTSRASRSSSTDSVLRGAHAALDALDAMLELDEGHGSSTSAATSPSASASASASTSSAPVSAPASNVPAFAKKPAPPPPAPKPTAAAVKAAHAGASSERNAGSKADGKKSPEQAAAAEAQSSTAATTTSTAAAAPQAAAIDQPAGASAGSPVPAAALLLASPLPQPLAKRTSTMPTTRAEHIELSSKASPDSDEEGEEQSTFLGQMGVLKLGGKSADKASPSAAKKKLSPEALVAASLLKAELNVPSTSSRSGGGGSAEPTALPAAAATGHPEAASSIPSASSPMPTTLNTTSATSAPAAAASSATAASPSPERPALYFKSPPLDMAEGEPSDEEYIDLQEGEDDGDEGGLTLPSELGYEFVQAVVDSGGDPAQSIPPFRKGDIMRVIGLHDVGWLEVEEGFMSPAWVQPVYHPEEEVDVATMVHAAEVANTMAQPTLSVTEAPEVFSASLGQRPALVLSAGQQVEADSDELLTPEQELALSRDPSGSVVIRPPSATAGVENHRLSVTSPVPRATSVSSIHAGMKKVQVTFARMAGQPLGLQIVGGSDLPARKKGIFIKTVKTVGAAAADGRLRRGDCIIRVNDSDFTDATHATAVDILRRATGDVTFTVLRRERKSRRVPRIAAGSISTSANAPSVGRSMSKVDEGNEAEAATPAPAVAPPLALQATTVTRQEEEQAEEEEDDEESYGFGASFDAGSKRPTAATAAAAAAAAAHIAKPAERSHAAAASGIARPTAAPPKPPAPYSGVPPPKPEQAAEEVFEIAADVASKTATLQSRASQIGLDVSRLSTPLAAAAVKAVALKDPGIFSDNEESSDEDEAANAVAAAAIAEAAPLARAPTRILHASEQQRRQQLAEESIKMENRRTGWLTKQGGGGVNKEHSMFSRKNWKRRYFVLQGTILKYHKTIPVGGETATGYINLDMNTSIAPISEKAFAIATPKRTYHLVADSALDAQQWIKTLRDVTNMSKKEFDNLLT